MIFPQITVAKDKDLRMGENVVISTKHFLDIKKFTQTHDVMKYDIMKYDILKYEVMKYDVMKYVVMKYNAMKYDVI